MAFFDMLNDFAKNIGDKTSDAIETGKLNTKINAEKSAAGEELKKIGQFFYDRFAAGEEVAPEVIEFCQAAKAHFDVAAEAQAEIDRIKEENEAAKVAAAEKAAAEKAAAQAVAAASMAAASPSAAQSPVGGCLNCGTVNHPGTKFCQNCGTKLEAAPPQERTCPGCGTVVQPGVKFCSECGTKME